MQQPKKVANGVYVVGSDTISTSGDCMVYAIDIGNNSICLIDAGTEMKSILDNIEKTPLKGKNITPN